MNKTLSKVALTIFVSLASLSANAEYTFSLLNGLNGNNLEGNNSRALAINSSGQIVGYSFYSDGSSRATLWNNGVASNLASLGGADSVALAINDSGQIVGHSNLANGQSNATLWNNGTASNLGTLGGSNSSALSINNSGQIVGWSYTSYGSYNATLWSGGAITDLGAQLGNSKASAINNSGQIVGWSANADGARAKLWDNGVVTGLDMLASSSGGSYSNAYGINDSGKIVGNSTIANGQGHATLWDSTVPFDLGTAPPAFTSYAFDINNSGQIVGTFYSQNSSFRAKLWDAGVETDLNSLLSASDVSAGWVLKEANAINENGWIVGTASNSLLGISNQAFVLTSTAPVPEAGTSAMLLMGAGVMGFMARRRKQAAA